MAILHKRGAGLFLALLVPAVGLDAPVAWAQADLQELGATQDEILRYNSRSVQGGSITFCINTESVTADFDREVARAVTQALLLDYKLYEVTTLPPTPPYDFRLMLDDADIFRLLLNNCDAIVGFSLLADYPGWMRPSPPYLSTSTVVAVRAGQYRELADIPKTMRLGTRSFSIADNYLRTYASTLPEDSRWRRNAYSSNEILVDRLVDGTVEAALVWEPALLAYAADHPDAPAIDILPSPPFTIPPTQLVFALRPQDDFVNVALSQAIEALRADGVLDELAARYHLVAVEAEGPR